MDDAEVPISVVSVGLTVPCTLNREASEIVRVSVSLGDGPHTAARKRPAASACLPNIASNAT